MTSNASTNAGTAAPQASERYQVTPCIIIAVGEAASARFESLRASVEFWIGERFPSEGVRWGLAPNDQQLTIEQVAQLLKPLLDFELWLAFRDQGYVDEIPTEDSLTPVRAFLLYDSGQDAPNVDLLRGVSEQLSAAAAGRAALRQTLILLSSGLLPSIILPEELFDRVFVIGQVGKRGLGIDSHVQYDIARILLHALIASDAVGIIDHWIGAMAQTSSSKILGVGAAAITTALAHMRDYRAAKIAQVLLRPYVGELSAQEQQEFKKAGALSASQVHHDWGMPALQALNRHGWTTTETTDRLGSVLPLPGSMLANAIRDCSADLSKRLADHLARLDQAFGAAFLLERQKRIAALVEQIGVVAAGRIHRPDRTRSQAESSLSRQAKRPSSAGEGQLAQVMCWFEGLFQALSASGYLSKQAAHIQPIYASDQDGWRGHAAAAAAVAWTRHRNFVRLKQATGSPLQLACRVFPAWPLLALIGRSFLDYPDWLLWIGALGLLVIITLLCALFWEARLKALDRQLYTERLNHVRLLVLGLASHYTYVEHQAIVEAMATIQRETETLATELSRQFDQADEHANQIVDAAKRISQQPALTEYVLYDLALCTKWVEDIVKHGVFRSSSLDSEQQSGLPAEQIGRTFSAIVQGMLRGRMPGVVAARLSENIVADLGAYEPEPWRLAAVELCDADQTIGGGDRRWAWLYDRAHPMMGAGLKGPELTIVALSDPSDLAGAHGRSSQRWRHWREARSRQPHRITCLRVALLPDVQLSHPADEQMRQATGSARHFRPLKTHIGHMTNVGKTRLINEDAMFVWDSRTPYDGQILNVGLYIVADGMGGHQSGEVASDIAIHSVSQALRDDLKHTPGLLERHALAGIYDLIRAAVQRANDRILEQASQYGNDMGATLTMVVVIGDRAIVANVGDSRTYLYRGGQLSRITSDHSLVMRLVEAGQIREDELYTHPQRNVILRSLGEKQTIDVDIFEEQLQPGDGVLLCSDGLWEMVRDQQIMTIMERCSDPQGCCGTLIDAANTAGGEDNITVILVRFADPTPTNGSIISIP